jgi:hypothetical protein
MRPAGKARRARIPGVFERGATQPDGMQRRPNAAGLSPRAASQEGPPRRRDRRWRLRVDCSDRHRRDRVRLNGRIRPELDPWLNPCAHARSSATSPCTDAAARPPAPARLLQETPDSATKVGLAGTFLRALCARVCATRHLLKPMSVRSRQVSALDAVVVAHFTMTVAFGRRCIPSRGVARRSNIPDILRRRALRDGRLGALGASP